MRTINVTNNLTLDGVMQAPGGKDEDPRSGFRHGGWATPYHDAVKMRINGDAADAVAKLKNEPGDDLTRLGSGELVRSLVRRDLIDQLILLIHPLVLGCGRRLFYDDGPSTKFRLANSTPTTTGVIIATYELA